MPFCISWIPPNGSIKSPNESGKMDAARAFTVKSRRYISSDTEQLTTFGLRESGE